MSSTIFVVDSSPAVRRLVEHISKQEGCDVQGFQDGPSALDAARRMSPNFIIADYHLENMTFSGFCKEVNKLDNLAETYIVSLTSPSDRVDETHLRSLGVKAFLNKPFQSENLIDVIKDLEAQQASRTNGTKKKSRSWPPVSSTTDSDHDDLDEDNQTEEEEEQAPALASQPKNSPTVAGTTAAEPEEAMKGLFSQLLQSMSERTEKKIADLLPQMVGKQLPTLVTTAVETEARARMNAALSEERLAQVLEPLLTTALPKILSQEMSLLEPTIRQSVFEIANPIIKERVDIFVREELNAVRTALADMVRDELKSIEGLVKEEIQQAAAKQTSGMVEELVRATAREQVELTVQRLVPNLAEEQIKAEIARLTQAA